MAHNIDIIIQSAYTVFGKYPKPSESLHACTCDICLSPELELQMRSLSLRELTVEHFYQYNNAPIDEENAEELKYFFPRMLELFVENQELHHSLELYFVRFGRCAGSCFSEEEAKLWNQFAYEYLTQLLQKIIKDGECMEGHLFDYLLMFHKGCADIRPFLQSVQENHTPQVIDYFVKVALEENADNLPFNNPFADDEPEYRKLVRTLLDNFAGR